MALKYDSSYSATGTDDTDVLYPGGKGVNATTKDALDGFPAKADRSNDLLGFLQWLIRRGSRGRVVTKTEYASEVSGVPDDSVSSDYGNGLQAIINPIDPSIDEYDSTDNYVFGDLVQSYGSQYLCLVANGAATTVSNPVADVYGNYWYELPSENWLRQQAQTIKPFFLGIKPVFDYNDASYQMVFPFGSFRKGNQKIDYYLVLHDDSNVISSGDDAYNAMAYGTKGEEIASLSGGDYTMINGQDCVLSAMGDNRPASFGRQEDGMQRVKGSYDIRSLDGGGDIQESFTGALSITSSGGGARTAVSASGNNSGDIVNFDNSAGGTYKTVGTGTGDGETRVKSLLGGPLGSIVAYPTTI